MSDESKLGQKLHDLGLDIHSLVMVYDQAYKSAAPGDEFAANPGKWPITRGVRAVVELMITAYENKLPPSQE